jgi:hypothetical protein
LIFVQVRFAVSVSEVLTLFLGALISLCLFPIKAAFAYYDASFQLVSGGFDDDTVSSTRRIGNDEHV